MYSSNFRFNSSTSPSRLDFWEIRLGGVTKAKAKHCEGGAAEERCRELESKLEEAQAAMVDEKQKIIDMLEARLKIS